jgi:hypothetical protein
LNETLNPPRIFGPRLATPARLLSKNGSQGIKKIGYVEVPEGASLNELTGLFAELGVETDLLCVGTGLSLEGQPWFACYSNGFGLAELALIRTLDREEKLIQLLG